MKHTIRHTSISKRDRNGINARIKKAVEKYGFDAVRLVSKKYFEKEITKIKLERTIQAKERELNELRDKGR